MSKLSRFLIGVIITGLAFIAGIHLYRAYERYVQQTQSEEANATQTFHRVPVSYQPLPPQLPVYKRYPEQGLAQEVYLEDPVLPPEQEQEQARQTVKSILSDYQRHEKVLAFYADLQQATGKPIRLEDLSSENLVSLMLQYPQIQDVIIRHSQDPEFAAVMREVFTNPQFVQSVAVLQQAKLMQ